MEIYVGYIFADIHCIIIIKHKKYFFNIVLNVCLSCLFVELWFVDIIKNNNYMLRQLKFIKSSIPSSFITFIPIVVLYSKCLLIPSWDSYRNGLILPRDSSMSGQIHHNLSLVPRNDWAQNLMSQHNSKPKEPCRSH